MINIAIEDYLMNMGYSNEENFDMTPVVFSALNDCKNIDNALLTFTKGIYHFWPEKAYEKYYFMSNND